MNGPQVKVLFCDRHSEGPTKIGYTYLLGQAIGPLWDFCAPISIVVEL